MLHSKKFHKIVITTGIVVGTFLPSITPDHAFHAAILTLAVNMLWIWD